MKRFIRTKDGKIYNTHKRYNIKLVDDIRFPNGILINGVANFINKQADTIEELIAVGDWIRNLDNCIFMVDTEEHRQELIKCAKKKSLYVVNTLYIDKNGDLIKTAEKIDGEWRVI